MALKSPAHSPSSPSASDTSARDCKGKPQLLRHTGMNWMYVPIKDDGCRGCGCGLGVPSRAVPPPASPAEQSPHGAPTPVLGKYFPSLRKRLVQSASHFLHQKYLEESKRSGEEGSCKAEEAVRHSQPRHGDARELERHKRMSGLCSPLEPQRWQR